MIDEKIFINLEKIAKELVAPEKLNKYVSIGDVSCALITDKGNIYTGINIDTSCSLGFCAEHSAISEMLKNREYNIKAIVAINENYNPIPPCGRCRELISQISEKNTKTYIKVSKDRILQLKDLLPLDWKDVKKEPII